jgi:hypothetical protein
VSVPLLASEASGCWSCLPFSVLNRGPGKIATRWSLLRYCGYFGGLANSESPVALRPPLARGLPFSTALQR